MENKKVIYYHSLEDDFADFDIQTKKLDENFEYVKKDIFWRAAAFMLYYGIACPVVELYTKVIFGVRYENKSALKKVRKSGLFLYGTHTHWADTFVSHMLAVRAHSKGHIIAGPDAMSIKGLKNIVHMLGTIPIPATVHQQKDLIQTVTYYYNQGDAIAMYPEKHIWPYFNGVRSFSTVSFRYPAKLNAPVIAHVTFYRKRRFFKSPAMTVKISDPIYPDMSLSLKDRMTKLRDQVYGFMCEATKGSYQYIQYKKK